MNRHYPEIPEKARFIKEKEARQKLLELYFRSVGIAQKQEISKLFGWRQKELETALTSLLQSHVVVDRMEIENESGEWICLQEICHTENV